MKVLVLGMGLQGKAVVHDLEQSSLIDEIIVADVHVKQAERYLQKQGYRKTHIVQLDATQAGQLDQLMRTSGAQIVLCMLHPEFSYSVARAALRARIPFVHSSYAGKVAELAPEAEQQGVTILPEMGLDPGIDLVLARLAVEELDEVHGLYSYGGGIPEPSCAKDNPLHYKISWTFEGVLKGYQRPARFLKEGTEQSISATDIFRDEHIHRIDIPDIGTLEAYFNGDAVRYIERFGLGKSIRDMGRFAVRWPGHCQFWQALVDLGFLEETALNGDPTNLSPRQFLVKHLTPRLQFRQDERDVAILRILAWGHKDGQKLRVTYDLIDYRDPQTGLFAMNRTVGFTVSIAAQMILSGKITKAGVLSPAQDVPPHDLVEELTKRGIQILKNHEVLS